MNKVLGEILIALICLFALNIALYFLFDLKPMSLELMVNISFIVSWASYKSKDLAKVKEEA